MEGHAETSNSQVGWAALSSSSYRSLCVVRLLKNLNHVSRQGFLRINSISLLEWLRSYSHFAPPFQFCTRSRRSSRVLLLLVTRPLILLANSLVNALF